MIGQEISVTCPCEKGFVFKTSLKNDKGHPVMFILGEDESIFFSGYCSHCGGIVRYSVPILTLLFECPSNRREQ